MKSRMKLTGLSWRSRTGERWPGRRLPMMELPRKRKRGRPKGRFMYAVRESDIF